MVDIVEQMLRPGERVIYRAPHPRVPRNWRWILVDLGSIAVLIAALRLYGYDWADFSFSTALSSLTVVFGMRGLFHLAGRKIDVAVTDQRALAVDQSGEQLAFTSVELEQARRVEVADRAVWVTKANGRLAILGNTAYAPEVGRALARAVMLIEQSMSNNKRCSMSMPIAYP